MIREVTCHVCYTTLPGDDSQSIEPERLIIGRYEDIENYGWSWIRRPGGEYIPVCPDCQRSRGDHE